MAMVDRKREILVGRKQFLWIVCSWSICHMVDGLVDLEQSSILCERKNLHTVVIEKGSGRMRFIGVVYVPTYLCYTVHTEKMNWF
jgi:hypothetical protein